jgi:hypothetical protein
LDAASPASGVGLSIRVSGCWFVRSGTRVLISAIGHSDIEKLFLIHKSEIDHVKSKRQPRS